MAKDSSPTETKLTHYPDVSPLDMPVIGAKLLQTLAT
jgi:hypothetical protein